MQALIDVFRMTEIKPSTRAEVILKLGSAINNEFGSNITEPLVYELVEILDPFNLALKEPHYLLAAGKIDMEGYRKMTSIKAHREQVEKDLKRKGP